MPRRSRWSATVQRRTPNSRAVSSNERRGSHGFKLNRGQATLDWLCGSSSNACGGGVDTIGVGAERRGAGVEMLSLIVRPAAPGLSAARCGPSAGSGQPQVLPVEGLFLRSAGFEKRLQKVHRVVGMTTLRQMLFLIGTDPETTSSHCGDCSLKSLGSIVRRVHRQCLRRQGELHANSVAASLPDHCVRAEPVP